MSTSTVQDRNAPSAGTKVTPGQDAPVYRESTGAVGNESLAAESYNAGAGFSENPNSAPENLSSQGGSYDSELPAAANSESRKNAHDATQTSSERYDDATGRSSNNLGDSYGGTAPSYVANQYHSDPNGPHGKNLSEGDWDESQGRDGLKKALASEPGSSNDPSRLAEQGFQQEDFSAAGGAGPRETTLNKGGAYDALGSNVSS